tara:strand:+ start:995 stop:1444 length:450 start_codon:yes stop_codon:yes gene_type:complete
MTGVFEGVGTLQFSPDNKLAYAYSGVKDYGGVQHQEYTILEFTTTSEYLDSKFQYSFSEYQSDDTIAIIKLNDIIVSENYFNDTRMAFNYGMSPILLVIPPFTNVKVIMINKATATAYEVTASMIAEVAGAIEQENLEAITDNNNWANK